NIELVCLPNGSPSITTTTIPTATPSTTSTTTLPVPPAAGAGLQAEITGVTIGADGTVVASFTLRDDAGVPIKWSADNTTDPNLARVRMTIARLEENPLQTANGTLTYTEYVSYVVGGSGNPGFDSGGTFAPDDRSGVYTYTFKTKLPAGYDPNLTHTVGAQIDRTNPEPGSPTLHANPIRDFRPAGGAPVTVREPVTTAECNQCHDPLAIHGGGRR